MAGVSSDAGVTMRLSDGFTISEWSSFSWRDTFTDPLGALDFELKPQRDQIADYYRRIQKGDKVELFVNQRKQGIFVILARPVTIDRGAGTVIKIRCASLLAIPYQASVDPDIATHYPSDSPVSVVVLKAFAPFGFTDIKADTAASRRAMTGATLNGAKPAFDVKALKHKDAQAQEGESAYAFAARFWTRLGVMLRVDLDGVLQLAAPDYVQSASYALVQDFDGKTAGNRMLDGIEIEDSNDEQFSECTVRGVSPDDAGQTSSARPVARVAVTGTPTTGKEVFPNVKPTYLPFGGHAYRSPSTAFPYKPRHLLDKSARDTKRCASAATFVMGLKAAKAFSISCEVDGIVSAEGHPWAVDMVASVSIDAIGLSEDMWILERTMTLDGARGLRTRLVLLPLGALVLGEEPGS